MRFVVALALVGCINNDDVPAPHVGGVTPASAPVGALVVVNGAYFCQQPTSGEDPTPCDQNGTVDFGELPGTVASWNDIAITVEVPSGAGAVSLGVIAAGRPSNRVAFVIE